MWWLALAVVGAPVPNVELPAVEAAAYFAGGPFAAARRTAARGAHAKAVKMLKRLLIEYPEAPERPQARYLLGLSMIRAGAYEEAASLFEDLSREYPALRDDHTYYRGQALYLWGSYLDAARALAQVAPDGPWAEPARHLRGWALLKATDFSRLVRWLESEEKSTLDDELTFVLAGGRARTSDPIGAFRAYRRVWRTTARPDLAGPALVAMSRLRVESGPMMASRAARAVRLEASSLQSTSRFTGALVRLERRLRAIGPKGVLRAEISYARGRIAEARQRWSSAARWYGEAKRRAPSEAIELRAAVALARGRMLERLERETESLAAYRELASRFADRPEAEQALFRAADLQLRARRYEAAKSACQQLLVSNPVSRFRRRCLWNSAWAEYRLGRFSAARQFFSTLARGPMPPDLDAAVRYWLGRTEADLGKTEQAHRWWQQVLDRHPLGYYAMLAERQLADGGRTAKPSKRTPPPDEKLAAQLDKAREYLRLGLKDRAYEAAMAYEAEMEERSQRLPAVDYRALGQLYQAVRKYADARRVREEAARLYADEPGAEEFLAAARRAHPLKFEREIRRAAKEFNLPAPLLFALVRTESGFRSSAVSAMNAYGLAQLILPTARSVAKRIRAGRVNKRRLLNNPQLNVRLGAAYLRQLLDRYDGREPLAVAAYNAGPHAVDAWLRRRVRRLSGIGGRGVGLSASPDEFAEEVPVEETQRFVKAVLSRARAYSVLYPVEEQASPPPNVDDVDDTMRAGEVAAALVEPVHVPEPPAPRYALPEGVWMWRDDALADPDAGCSEDQPSSLACQ